jgi:hypothetical protein
MGGLQSRSGCCGEEKYSQPLPGLEPRIIQPAAQRYTTIPPTVSFIVIKGLKYASR